jgi:hypothetical protein
MRTPALVSILLSKISSVSNSHLDPGVYLILEADENTCLFIHPPEQAIHRGSELSPGSWSLAHS